MTEHQRQDAYDVSCAYGRYKQKVTPLHEMLHQAGPRDALIIAGVRRLSMHRSHSGMTVISRLSTLV